MSVMLVCLYPEQTLPGMLDLRLITNPRGPWQEYVALQDIEECEQQRLRSWCNDDLIGTNREAQAA